MPLDPLYILLVLYKMATFSSRPTSSSGHQTSGNSIIGSLNCERLIRDMVENGNTHQTISLELQQLFPGFAGLSTRSVRRFCSSRSIHYSSRVSFQDLNHLVEQAVFRVGCCHV